MVWEIVGASVFKTVVFCDAVAVLVVSTLVEGEALLVWLMVV